VSRVQATIKGALAGMVAAEINIESDTTLMNVGLDSLSIIEF
jgi:acyl carrier protein